MDMTDQRGLDGAVGSDVRRFDSATFYDPFDPASACGSTRAPSVRLPGTIVLVMDRSGSMKDRSDGSSTRWELAVGAVRSTLASMSDDVNVGLVLFPTDENCAVSTVPAVAIAPLRTSRAGIFSKLDGSAPDMGNTPMIDATLAGYRMLDAAASLGRSALVVVTDGGESCATSSGSMTINPMEEQNLLGEAAFRASHDVFTFAVGLETSNNLLSALAQSGATPRTPTCQAMCTNNGRVCSTDANCVGGRCTQVVPFFPIKQCTDSPELECCNHRIDTAGFEAEFQRALTTIAERVTQRCVFELPRPTTGNLDLGLVNVGVTFPGNERVVLRRTSITDRDGWDAASSSARTITIGGPICERLRRDAAEVEIVLGCPTLII